MKLFYALLIFFFLPDFLSAQNQQELFDDFLEKFSSSPAFQLTRVFDRFEEHVDWERVSRSTNQRTLERITKNQWKHLDFRKNKKNDPIPAEWIILPAAKYNQGRTVILSGIGNELYIEFSFAYRKESFDRGSMKRIPERWILWSITETIP